MDVLYYSNYCKHSTKVLDFLVKGGLVETLNCICVDKRKRHPQTNQIVVYLENGKQATMPPNVHSVPSLLLVSDNYKLVMGSEIIKHYEPKVRAKLASANFHNGEPTGVPISAISGSGSSNIISEQYTMYDLTPEELSTKGNGGRRQFGNYVPVSMDAGFIPTPPDTYRPDKIAGGTTIEQLQQQRNAEVPISDAQKPMYQYQTM
jgi:hypothetical protein